MHVTCSQELFKLTKDQKKVIDEMMGHLDAKDKTIAELNEKISLLSTKSGNNFGMN
jgi:hypothetical protein